MKNAFKVEWDADNCPNPQDCGNCLDVCPEAVFALYAPEREEGKFPEKYVLARPMQYFCSGCGACVEVCPSSALRVIPKTST
ncbi:MAG: 4Fe-4S dicluster domain-containing protein [Candidatus Odinarchaeota archaeon]